MKMEMNPILEMYIYEKTRSSMDNFCLYNYLPRYMFRFINHCQVAWVVKTIQFLIIPDKALKPESLTLANNSINKIIL